MVFGQPRQDDRIEHLRRSVPKAISRWWVDDYRWRPAKQMALRHG